jgi:hypothetical protein
MVMVIENYVTEAKHVYKFDNLSESERTTYETGIKLGKLVICDRAVQKLTVFSLKG